MPSTTPAYEASRSSVKHVNLMLDTFIANAPVSDLRAVIRTLLTTNPGTIKTFNAIVRSRLQQLHTTVALPSPSSMFTISQEPTHHFTEILEHARMLFGAGLGIDSLGIYTHIIRSTFALRWEDSEDDPLLQHLAIVDADLAQAIQSSKEEVAAGLVKEITSAKATLEDVYGALEESQRLVEAWGGEYCFDRAYFAAADWRLTL